MKKLMKILLLNPKVNAEHQIAKGLRQKGIALLFPATLSEAWQMLQLHGASIDAAIIHRESPEGPDGGVSLVSKLKKDPQYQDLPIIFTSEKWTEEECGIHQNGPE